MSSQSAELLEKYKLRNTSFRRDVMDIFLSEERAFSKKEIEGKLNNPDRITLYRTLKTFESKGIIHIAYDNTNTVKYAKSNGASPNDVTKLDNHAHFHCIRCQETFCIDSLSPPSVEFFEDYEVLKCSFVIEGICPSCKEATT